MPGPDAHIPVRPAARVILLDDSDRVLLEHINDELWNDPDDPLPPLRWITVGGGVELGETFEQTAVREVREETGLARVTLGPLLWKRRLTLSSPTGMLVADEQYFAGRVHGRVDPSDAAMEDAERSTFLGFGWWSHAQLVASREVFAPSEIVRLSSLAARRMPR